MESIAQRMTGNRVTLTQIENIVKQKTEAKPLASRRTYMPARLLLHQSENEYHFVGIAVE